MTPLDLSGLLASPTTPTVREALRHMPPHALDALATEVLAACDRNWKRVVVDRVSAFAAGQPGHDPAPVAAYFTATEDGSTEELPLRWSPFVAALANTDDIPDLMHTHTTAVFIPEEAAALSEEILPDPQLREALDRLAALDPPSHADILRVHLPNRQVTRLAL